MNFMSSESKDKNNQMKSNVVAMYNFPETNLSTESGQTPNLNCDQSHASDAGPGALGLVWQNGIATLPGSDLQFSLNSVGELEVISGTEEQNEEQQNEMFEMENEEDYLQPTFDKNLDEMMTHESSDDIIAVCQNCSKEGNIDQFFNGYCSKMCMAKHFKRKHETSKNKTQDDHLKHRKLLKVEACDKKFTEDGEKVPEVSVAGDLKMTIRLPNSTRSTHLDEEEDISHGSSKFSWRKYLEHSQALPESSVAITTGKGAFPCDQNPFKVGWYVEAVDAVHQSKICRMQVAQVEGYRMRLHIDGEYSCYDQWINADSPLLFPSGFCEQTDRHLWLISQGIAEHDEFAYFDPEKTTNEIFASRVFENQTKFKIGDKLEAVDRQHSELTCVATVIDAIGEYVLIHFDGWQSEYDYWARYNSPFLHPIGWCNANGKELSSPPNCDLHKKFSWPKYLENTKSRAAPSDIFSSYKPSDLFEVGMKLEVVDERNPILVRVASIVDVDDCRIRIHFDGWSDLFDRWIDADSHNIHPPNWCSKTNHHLQPPVDVNNFTGLLWRKGCTIPGCYGLGHVNWTRELFYHKKHFSEHGCPYSPQNLDKDFPLNRFNSSDEVNQLLANDNNGSFASNASNKPKRGRPRKVSHVKGKTNLVSKKPTTSKSTHRIPNENKLPPNPQMTPSLPIYPHTQMHIPQCWERVVGLLPGVTSLKASDVAKWDVKMTATFINILTGSCENKVAFIREEIDGEALLLLTQDDITKQLKLKLGPAVKIFNAVLLFKTRSELQAA